jgi:A1 cistron-splicing factor AAR2
MGVKMIPPGVHLVTTQAVQQQPQHAPPPAAAPALAVFVSLAPRSVLVRGWDAQAEALACVADADDEARLAAGARRGDFDQGLAPYDLGRAAGGGGGAGGATTAAATTPTTSSGWERWRALAGLITPELARRLMPAAEGGDDAMPPPLSVTAEAAAVGEEGGGGNSRSAAERRLEEQLAEGWRRRQEGAVVQVEGEEEEQEVEEIPRPPPFSSSSSSPALSRLALAPPPEPGRARYTPVERLSKLRGLTPAQLTEANLDRSSAAEALLRAVVEREEEEGKQAPAPSSPPLPQLLRRAGPLVLGELQFAFAAFAAGGQSLEGFHQWRSIACLLLACERLPFGCGGTDAASSSSAFFAAFLRVLAAQLKYALAAGTQSASPLLVDDDLLRQSFLPAAVRRFSSALGAAERQRQGAPSPSPLAEVRASAELVVAALRDAGLLVDQQGGQEEGEEEEEEEEDGPIVVDLDAPYAL